MARLYFGALQAVLDADIDTDDTAVTFAESLKEYGTTEIDDIDSPDYIALYREGEVVFLTDYDKVALTGTISRGELDSTAVAHTAADTVTTPFKHGPQKDDVGISDGGGVAAGSILGITQYDPGTMALYDTTSSTYADIDAANIAVTFDAPASGNVLVRLTGSIKTASNNQIGWGLREGTTNLAGGLVAYGGASSLESHHTIAFMLSGVTAGSHTYKASQARAFGAGTVTTRVGGTSAQAGPFVMEVVALP